VKALLRSAAEKGYDFKTLLAVEAVNEVQKQRLVDKMERHFKTMKGRTFALWGLAFKPRTDDMREAPAIPIIERLLELGASVPATASLSSTICWPATGRPCSTASSWRATSPMRRLSPPPSDATNASP